MFCTLFVTGGVAFWLLLLAASVLFFACEENDDSPSGTILAIIAFLGCWFLLGDLKTVVAESPWAAAFCPLLWVGLGMLWSFPALDTLSETRSRRLYRYQGRLYEPGGFAAARFRELGEKQRFLSLEGSLRHLL